MLISTLLNARVHNMKRIYARIILKIIPEHVQNIVIIFLYAYIKRYFQLHIKKTTLCLKKYISFKIFLFKHACTV